MAYGLSVNPAGLSYVKQENRKKRAHQEPAEHVKKDAVHLFLRRFRFVLCLETTAGGSEALALCKVFFLRYTPPEKRFYFIRIRACGRELLRRAFLSG